MWRTMLSPEHFNNDAEKLAYPWHSGNVHLFIALSTGLRLRPGGSPREAVGRLSLSVKEERQVATAWKAVLHACELTLIELAPHSMADQPRHGKFHDRHLQHGHEGMESPISVYRRHEPLDCVASAHTGTCSPSAAASRFWFSSNVRNCSALMTIAAAVCRMSKPRWPPERGVARRKTHRLVEHRDQIAGMADNPARGAILLKLLPKNDCIPRSNGTTELGEPEGVEKLKLVERRDSERMSRRRQPEDGATPQITMSRRRHGRCLPSPQL